MFPILFLPKTGLPSSFSSEHPFSTLASCLLITRIYSMGQSLSPTLVDWQTAPLNNVKYDCHLLPLFSGILCHTILLYVSLPALCLLLLRKLWCGFLFAFHSNQLPRSTQPGHPSMGRRNEYQLRLGR